MIDSHCRSHVDIISEILCKIEYVYRSLLLLWDFIVPAHQACILVLYIPLLCTWDCFWPQSIHLHPPFVFPVDIIVPPHLMCVCLTFGPFCHPGELEEEMENPEMADLPEKQKHQLRHRELFLSRQLESLPATHIRYTAVHHLVIIQLNDLFQFVSRTFVSVSPPQEF